MILPLQQDDALLADMLTASGDALHVWWLGQSGFLIKQGGSFALLDPYLSDSLTLKYATTDKPHVRMTARCIAPERLGFVKLVTSSHQHTDHFDEATLVPLATAADGIKLVLPAAVESAARNRLGDAKVELLGLDDGTSIEIDGWRFTGIAAAHNEIERDALGRCKFLGFIIERNGFAIYHSGDTLLHDGLVPALLPKRCDIAFVPINGNRPERRVAGNLNGPEAATLAHQIGARLAVPHHFEMFEFNTASPEEFVATCERLGQPHRVMRCGERISVDH
jgi:L-ascorbate metabolism protein UlaG (beta-lactamase superfamily)